MSSKRNIFEPRFEARPFEYPEAIELLNMLADTYWRHTELSFNADVNDIDNLPPHEKEIVLRSLLAISTIEVAVKSFWGQLGSHFPANEWDMLGIQAAESENRHFLSYSHLLNLLNLDKRFSEVKEIPAIKGRYDYLHKYLKLSPQNSDKRKYVIKLILFSILIEHVSLFASFATVLYFFRHKGIMKDIRNIISWSSLDEKYHFKIGATIINILREEQPEMFDEEMEEIVRKACIKSIKYEGAILDWIFEHGELEKMSKEDLNNYMKNQVNESLIETGFKPCFEDVGDLSNTDFFFDEIFAESMDDFLAMRPVDYTIGDISITKDSLF